jgi:hypothetical protein
MNRTKISVNNKLLTRIAEMYPDCTVTRALELHLSRTINDTGVPQSTNGNNNEYKQQI